MCKLTCLEAQIRPEQPMQKINYLWIWYVQMPNKQALWFRVMNQLSPNPWGSVLICVRIFALNQSAAPIAPFQKLRLQ